MTIPHRSNGFTVTETEWNELVDGINTANTEISSTGIIQRMQEFRGLYLRTHTDADQAANKLSLLGLDEVVLDDGARYIGLTLPLTADITTTGAGALDTGSRNASTWYEVYAIGKSSTKAAADVKLLLHRALNYGLDQSQTTQDTNFQLRFGATTNVKIGQSFICGVSGLMPFVDLTLSQNGSVTGRIWVTIEANSSGTPSGTPLATSDKLDCSGIAASANVIRFPFRTPASLTSGTTYHVVLQGDYTASATNDISWYYKGTASSYASGGHETYNGTSWTTATLDMWFKTYITQNSTSITYPSGYDEKCLLGYVYNDGSNALRPFVANDRRVHVGWGSTPLVNGATNTVSNFVDASSAIPPIRCRALLDAHNRTSGQNAVVGGVPSGYASANLPPWEPGLIQRVYDTSTSFAQGINMDIMTEYQGIYAYCSGGTLDIWVAGFEW